MNYNNLTKEELITILNKEDLRKKDNSKRAIAWIRENQSARLYQSCKSNAIKRGLEFTLLQEDIIIPEYCPILKIKLTNISEKGRVKSNASVDRIDNSKGYTKDNIIITSDLANRMKQNASKEELINFAKGVLELYDRKTNT